jgi:DNA polymerase-1
MTRCYHNDLPTYGLKPLCKKILKVDDDELQVLKKACMQARRKGKKLGWQVAEDIEPDYWMVEDHSLVAKYALMDVVRTKGLHEWLTEQYKEDNQRPIYEKELKLLPVTYAMESRGITFDKEVLENEIAYHEKRVKESYAKFLKIGGIKEINLKSQPQLAKLLYGKLKIPCQFYTDKGKQCVDVNALAAMKHPIIDVLTDYTASKHALANFFLIYRRESEHPEKGDWILHPDFQQMGAVTGRFSCRKPNMQNVANALTTRSAKPIQARRPFRPKPGYTWFSFDYSQIEVWIFAILSGEQVMLKALLDNRDIHNETANHVWGWDVDEKTGQRVRIDIVAKEKKQDGKSNTRARAKMMVFGKIYGMGVAAAQGLIRCTMAEARTYTEDFDKAFPTIKQFMYKYSRRAESDGYIENAYGRRYFIESSVAYRAVNYLVQGSAADLLKEKMVETTNYLREKGIDGGLIMTIHDELIFEIKNSFATRTLLKKIKDIMEDHHGVFPVVKKFKVEAAKIISSSSWDKKIKIEL